MRKINVVSLSATRHLKIYFRPGGDTVYSVGVTYERIAIGLLLLALVAVAAVKGGKTVTTTIYVPTKAAPTLPDEATSEINWSEKDRAYVKRFQRTAIAEMVKYGIPASITMAQSILESGAGKSRLATKANAHHGIKCTKRNCEPGHCIVQADDTPHDRFIAYNTAWESFRAHSKFLHRNDRYKRLFNLDPKDYKGWAHGLKKCGYASDPDYGNKLVRLVEKYRLYLLDEGVPVVF